MNNRLMMLAAVSSAVLLTACSPEDTSGGVQGQRVLEKWDVVGAASTVTEFCRGPHKYIYLDGSHRGSIQKFENHPDCKETK